MDIINVNLYGGRSIFGGKEIPLEADIIYCDKYNNCSYYENGQCLNIRSFLSGCKYGCIQNVKGYTSRAMKYHTFKSEWTKHEKYNKLKYPPTKLGLIEDLIVFPYPHICIKQSENGELEIKNPSFSGKITFINYDKFTVDFIYKICTFRPQAMMGGEIKSYQNETVPLFLAHLKEIFPCKYEEYIKKYEGHVKEINYVGRKALLETIKPSYVYYNYPNYPKFNEKWYWDGEILTYKKGYVSSFNITKDYEILDIKIKPSSESTIQISDNKQVSEKTIFID